MTNASSMLKEGPVQDPFVFRALTSPEEMAEAFRLRYQVYCNECNFIKPGDYPSGSESDDLDVFSAHFGAYDAANRLVGSVRLILPSAARFPIEEHCPILEVDPSVVPRSQCAEVSRLTISKLYRRRSNDGLYYEPQSADKMVEDKGLYFMRRVRPMAFGLYRAMYQESKRRGIRYWYALMEKSLWMLLKIHGFVFKPVGPEVDFYGMVTPYLADLAELEKNVHDKFPQFYAFFTENMEPELVPKF
jgi:N-acyl amino acid synthase of PEP-CTERM/exosortase system